MFTVSRLAKARVGYVEVDCVGRGTVQKDRRVGESAGNRAVDRTPVGDIANICVPIAVLTAVPCEVNGYGGRGEDEREQNDAGGEETDSFHRKLPECRNLGGRRPDGPATLASFHLFVPCNGKSSMMAS